MSANNSSLMATQATTQAARELLARLIENVSVFDGLSETELLELLNGAEKKTAQKGQVILREGDSGRFMYVLIEGEASVTKLAQDGFAIHGLGILRAGDCFGEMALVDPALRSATVEALSDCVMIRLQESDCWKNPAISSKIYRNIARILAHRLREMQRMAIGGGSGGLAQPGDPEVRL